jgi:hypothetical protein
MAIRTGGRPVNRIVDDDSDSADGDSADGDSADGDSADGDSANDDSADDDSESEDDDSVDDDSDSSDELMDIAGDMNDILPDNLNNNANNNNNLVNLIPASAPVPQANVPVPLANVQQVPQANVQVPPANVPVPQANQANKDIQDDISQSNNNLNTLFHLANIVIKSSKSKVKPVIALIEEALICLSINNVKLKDIKTLEKQMIEFRKLSIDNPDDASKFLTKNILSELLD